MPLRRLVVWSAIASVNARAIYFPFGLLLTDLFIIYSSHAVAGIRAIGHLRLSLTCLISETDCTLWHAAPPVHICDLNMIETIEFGP